MSKPKRVTGGWHREDIKAAIRKKDTTLTKLATDNGLSAAAVRVAMMRPSPAAELVISAFLDVPLQELWPDRYDPFGRRLATRNVRDENKHERGGSHRLIAAAR